MRQARDVLEPASKPDALPSGILSAVTRSFSSLSSVIHHLPSALSFCFHALQGHDMKSSRASPGLAFALLMTAVSAFEAVPFQTAAFQDTLVSGGFSSPTA